jgi:hypothetical protein
LKQLAPSQRETILASIHVRAHKQADIWTQAI